MPPFGLHLNSKGYARTFVGKRASRQLGKFFDGIGGKEAILYLIERDRDLTSYMPSEQVYALTHQAHKYSDYVRFFSDEDVFNWLPDQYKGVIEAHPNGRAWAYRQVDIIRRLMLSS